ncbi:hypothetical protein [Empedobacter brevis]|uniref:hypothetical protein n=1 Tax=Empedobacter brevis TaxID=247 RepID=UPI0028974A94|nr:hypothetical protein [Empedobacter brevis]
MEFGITQELDTGTNKKSNLIQDISDNLESFLKNKNYGEDVETFLIGFVGVKTKPGYEEWYKERKPKYIDYRLTKSRLTGLPLETIKQYSYDIKFDYELYDEFVNGTEEESSKLLARKILESFSHLDKLPKKIKDFDKDKFKSDVEEFFKSNNLL